MSSTHRSALNVPLMITKVVGLSKEMVPQTTTSGCGPLWRALVNAGSPRCPGRLQSSLRGSSGLRRKRCSSLSTIRLQSS
ncbi:hypothetical protein TNCV_3089601 [Trichonephila clavipes]|nr:hypothetical protein TNCV_3089601 [Trichonephila clavipes]